MHCGSWDISSYPACLVIIGNVIDISSSVEEQDSTCFHHELNAKTRENEKALQVLGWKVT